MGFVFVRNRNRNRTCAHSARRCSTCVVPEHGMGLNLARLHPGLTAFLLSLQSSEQDHC